jgi:hypothetical protein
MSGPNKSKSRTVINLWNQKKDILWVARAATTTTDFVKKVLKENKLI